MTSGAWLAIMAASAAVVAIAGGQRGYSMWSWGLWGLLFGPFALAALYAKPKLAPQQQRQCQHCMSMINAQAQTCPHCRRDYVLRT